MEKPDGFGDLFYETEHQFKIMLKLLMIQNVCKIRLECILTSSSTSTPPPSLPPSAEFVLVVAF